MAVAGDYCAVFINDERLRGRRADINAYKKHVRLSFSVSNYSPYADSRNSPHPWPFSHKGAKGKSVSPSPRPAWARGWGEGCVTSINYLDARASFIPVRILVKWKRIAIRR